MPVLDAADRAGSFVPHAFAEHSVVAGDHDEPALLPIPGQTESWWGYEQALPLLAEHFQAYAIDLRGQGAATRRTITSNGSTR